MILNVFVFRVEQFYQITPGSLWLWYIILSQESNAWSISIPPSWKPSTVEHQPQDQGGSIVKDNGTFHISWLSNW